MKTNNILYQLAGRVFIDAKAEGDFWGCIIGLAAVKGLANKGNTEKEYITSHTLQKIVVS